MRDTIHVSPANDLIAHEDTDCVCRPAVQAVFAEDGSNGWLYIHHSLDRREDNDNDRYAV